MINSEDEILVEPRTSCTKEEAVAKMLGWLQGHIRQKYVRVTEHGVSADQLPFLHSLDGSLQDQLIELREAARLEFVKAAETGAAFEVIQAKEEAVIGYGNLINKAFSYLLDIDDEIAKGHVSALRVDQDTTTSTGIVHITLGSLDQWARTKYRIPILERTDDQLVDEGAEEQYDSPEERKKTAKGWISPRLSKNIYVTLAFLVEELAKRSPAFGGDGPPNVSGVAKHIAEVAAKAYEQQKMPDQSAEAIKDRIEAAIAIRDAEI